MNNYLHLYFFRNDDISNLYGIGTYTQQIIDLSLKMNLHLTIINLYSPFPDIRIDTENGIEYIYIPSDSHVFVEKCHFKYIRNVCYILKKYISVSSTNIYHLNYFSGEFLAKQIRALFQGKLVMTVHYTNWGIDLLGDIQWVLQNKSEEVILMSSNKENMLKNIMSDQRMLKYCDKIICVSNHSVLNMNMVYKMDVGYVRMINHGINDEYKKCNNNEIREIKKKYSIPTNKKILLYVGRLSEAKGVYVLINYFIRLSLVHSDCVLLIVGDGSFSKVIELSNRLLNRIFFLGRVSKSDLYRIYQIADIGVIPSYYEEFGYVAIEMMMHEIPLVVSDVGGLKEIVDEGITGYKVPLVEQDNKWMLDYSIFEKRIGELLKSTYKRKELGRNARKRFLIKYVFSVFANKMKQFYNNL